MEIQIIDNQNNLVQVDSAIGRFWGAWRSSPPVMHKWYAVELDCDDILTPDKVEYANSRNPRIEHTASGVVITGLVEEVEDKVMFLRLLNSLMMLYISADSDFVQYVGCYVRFKVSEISLFDMGIG